MIDLAILVLIAWGGMIGWQRGGIRALIDCMSAGSSAAVMIFSVPLLEDMLIDSSWALEIRRWIQLHITAVPAGLGSEYLGNGAADRLYHSIVVATGAAAVFLGIQIILHVYQTVWTQPHTGRFSRIAGAAAGSLMGGFMAVYMVQCLGLLSWFKGLESIDLYLAKSFLTWVALTWSLL